MLRSAGCGPLRRKDTTHAIDASSACPSRRARRRCMMHLPNIQRRASGAACSAREARTSFYKGALFDHSTNAGCHWRGLHGRKYFSPAELRWRFTQRRVRAARNVWKLRNRTPEHQRAQWGADVRQGVPDAEAAHTEESDLPEGLSRKRMGPLNKHTGRGGS